MSSPLKMRLILRDDATDITNKLFKEWYSFKLFVSAQVHIRGDLPELVYGLADFLQQLLRGIQRSLVDLSSTSSLIKGFNIGQESYSCTFPFSELLVSGGSAAVKRSASSYSGRRARKKGQNWEKKGKWWKAMKASARKRINERQKKRINERQIKEDNNLNRAG